jgi:hypothetical protein
MAVVAGDCPVARNPPGRVVVLHDVAVDAGLGVVRQVGITPGVPESEGARSGQKAEQDDDRGASGVFQRSPPRPMGWFPRARTASSSICLA